MNSSAHQPYSLRDMLVDRLDPTTAERLIADLTAGGFADHVYDLLVELRDISSKIAGEAVWALPELQRRCGFGIVVPWLDLGISLTQASGAIGLRYVKESPVVLGVIEGQDRRKSLLELTLELADVQSKFATNCAFEFFKKAPELLLEVPVTELAGWAEIGTELAQWDYVLGNEFFRESPSIAKVLGKEHVRDWVSFGMKLVTKNSLGKPDYVGTLEFFRTSPALLNEVPDPEVRSWVVKLGSVLADRSPQQAISFLADSPTLLQALPSSEWRLRVLKYGLLIADRDSESTLAYLRRAPEILHVGGDTDKSVPVFENWFRGGMEILEYSSEGGRAYFSLETRNALASVEEAMCGVPLRQVARSLKLFAQGMCGTDVTIQALSGTGEGTDVPSTHAGSEPTLNRPKVSVDEKKIFLPSIMRFGASRKENLRWYTVMTAHEAGHLEFGTYRIALDSLHRWARRVQERYSKQAQAEDGEGIRSLEELFALYPQPGVIRDLWEILEDARVDYLLQQEYPGLRHDLAQLTREAVKTRSWLHGMTAREMVLDALLLSFAEESSRVAVREDLRDVMAQAWTMAQTILHPRATPEEAIELADRLYQFFDTVIGSLIEADRNEWREETSEEQSDSGPGPRAAEHIAGHYRPITNWSYRGAMDPDLVRGETDADRDSYPADHSQGMDDQVVGALPSRQRASQETESQEHVQRDETDRRDREYGASPMKQWLESEGAHQAHQRISADGSLHFFYDEWDGTIHDYRPHWCRVVERTGQEGDPDFVDRTLAVHGPTVRLLRRYFEAIRPTALRRLGRQDQGEDFDLDALVQRVVDRRVSHEPSDRVYVRHEKRERQVAVAFLLDVSGSTGRQIGSDQRRVIDVEKEGLVLLSEAVAAIGDRYALYAYSGQGRGRVDLLTLKDFHESSLGRTALRISATTPLQQNRDGAAIRHTAFRLLQQSARTRLLVLISDGKPLDDGYGDEYSLEDTKVALREARMKGIHPFCITVDETASDYLKRMYGEVGFVVVDDAGTLPTRLPRIYQRLTT